MNIDFELEKLQFNQQEADMDMLYDFVDNLENLPNKREAIPAIFLFMEKNADKELGSPGPLVHFIEQESDYHQDLEASLVRNPTPLTVWMANRILNSLTSSEKQPWLKILSLVISNDKTNESVRNEAKTYLDYHKS